MFKIALGAGHSINTEGKRCMKALDPHETREWTLNDRICDYVERGLKKYCGYELLRLDDSDDGEENYALSARVGAANRWGANFYLSIHHNAGINGGEGGGIEAYSHSDAGESARWRDALYDALIARTGLSGNRSRPKATAEFYVLKNTNMPTVLLELGYMDSKTDVPVILTDEYAKQCAAAIVEVLAQRGGLTIPEGEQEVDETKLTQLVKNEVERALAQRDTAEARSSERVSPWAQEAWGKAIAAGVTDGTRPGGCMTREQAVTMFDRMGLLDEREEKE